MRISRKENKEANIPLSNFPRRSFFAKLFLLSFWKLSFLFCVWYFQDPDRCFWSSQSQCLHQSKTLGSLFVTFLTLWHFLYQHFHHFQKSTLSSHFLYFDTYCHQHCCHYHHFQLSTFITIITINYQRSTLSTHFSYFDTYCHQHFHHCHHFQLSTINTIITFFLIDVYCQQHYHHFQPSTINTFITFLIFRHLLSSTLSSLSTINNQRSTLSSHFS